MIDSITTSKKIEPVKDVDGIMKYMMNQLPIADGEILYKSEIDSQIKVCIGMVVLGLLMFFVSLLLEIKIWGA